MRKYTKRSQRLRTTDLGDSVLISSLARLFFTDHVDSRRAISQYKNMLGT